MPSTTPRVFRMLGRAVGRPYFPLAFVGRLPFAMMIVGVLTITAVEQGSLALAGVLAASAGLGTAVVGPLSGALADRLGQRAVLLTLAACSVVIALTFLLLVQSTVSVFVLIAGAALLGATTPQVAPFSRARLFGAAGDAPVAMRERARSVVMSYESMADEASFVLGPVIVGLASAAIAPWAPLVLSVVLTATVIPLFAVHPTARLVPASRTQTEPTSDLDSSAAAKGLRPPATPISALLTAELVTLVLAMLAVGGIFGATLTGLTGLLEQLGAVEQTGLLYGAMSVGAIATALAMIALPASVTLESRWVAAALLSVVGLSLLLLSGDLVITVIALFVSGCGVGASLVALFSLGAIAAPADRTNTVLVTLQSSLVVGQALVTAASGALVESASPQAAFTLGGTLALALTVLALVHSTRNWRVRR
ncbi:MFS transporter [Microcella sp.]|uniref:MFS transporter n=1 Tax=Microcella sp. TaxID=1913979 RepID=UPI002567C4C8|nr:MFS transporter [Microcella sp.]MBX9471969.1 MFS transporter [Microcella sp.]